jgi:3-oxo-5,6-didehydrosuberyl-CoA/3-oxoadipyl-CoA thiolase
LLLGTKDAAAKFGLQPLAKIVSCGISGVEPRIMGIGPVEASRKALEKAGLQWKDIDIIELNEAFAAQSLACIRQWGLKDDDERINPNGGAIALGHPLGMSGARIILTATLELQKRNARYALATMCIGVGQGYAVVLERPA